MAKRKKADTAPYATGWVDDPKAVKAVLATLPYPTFGTTPTFGALANADLPESVYLWKAYELLKGGQKTPTRNQGQVGSCVSFGTANAVERTMACEIVAGEREEFRDLAQEVIYAGSRVEVGGGRISGDGSVGAWAAKWVKEWGVVARGTYGSHNLSSYDEGRCRDWGRKGVPDDLEPEAKLHPCADVSQVNTAEEAKVALAAGHGIAVCSNQGFSMQRDSNGICKPSGSWAHCMGVDGYTMIDGALYFHIDNSWGPSAHTGPVGPGEPSTSGFWCNAQTAGRMFGSDDTFAFAGLNGWRTAVLPLWLF
jgi:hypothetical protein